MLISYTQVVGIEVLEMGDTTISDEFDETDHERLALHVDDRGRVTIPQSVRHRLGIKPDTDIPAYRTGSILTVAPQPSSNLQTATAGRDDWTNTTPTDAGESLFGPSDDTNAE